MKHLFILSLLVLIFACSPKEEYLIQGTLTGAVNGKAYLSNSSRTEPIKDTVDLIDGKFLFKGKVITPENYTITLENIKGSIPVALENAKYNVTASINSENIEISAIEGGELQNEANLLSKAREDISKKYELDKIREESRNPEVTETRRSEIRDIITSFNQEISDMEQKFYDEHPHSYLTLIYFDRNIDKYDMSKAEAMIVEMKSLEKFNGNRILNEAEDKLNVLKSLVVGQPAPQFTLNDPDGNPVALSDVISKNKLTMIDFWAGWCGPCRRFNPTLVQIYNKYKEHGFGILGVSLDYDRDSWLKAIADDGLVWTHVSDLKYWESAAAKQYYIRYIPQSAFVDQNGILVHRDAGQDGLESFLKEYFGL